MIDWKGVFQSERGLYEFAKNRNDGGMWISELLALPEYLARSGVSDGLNYYDYPQLLAVQIRGCLEVADGQLKSQLVTLIDRFIMRSKDNAVELASALVNLNETSLWSSVFCELSAVAKERLFLAFTSTLDVAFTSTRISELSETIKSLFSTVLWKSDGFYVGQLWSSSRRLKIEQATLYALIHAVSLASEEALKGLFIHVLEVWADPLRILYNPNEQYQMLICLSLSALGEYLKSRGVFLPELQSKVSNAVTRHLDLNNPRQRFLGLWCAEIISHVVYPSTVKLQFGLHDGEESGDDEVVINDPDLLKLRKLFHQVEFVVSRLLSTELSDINLALSEVRITEPEKIRKGKHDLPVISDDETASDVSSLESFPIDDSFTQEKPPKYLREYIEAFKNEDLDRKYLALKYFARFVGDSYGSIKPLFHKRELEARGILDRLLNLTNPNAPDMDDFDDLRLDAMKAVLVVHPDLGSGFIRTLIENTQLSLIQRHEILDVLTAAAVEGLQKHKSSESRFPRKLADSFAVDLADDSKVEEISEETPVLSLSEKKTRISHPVSRQIRLRKEQERLRSAKETEFIVCWFRVLAGFGTNARWLYSKELVPGPSSILDASLFSMMSSTVALLTHWIKTLVLFIQLLGPYNPQTEALLVDLGAILGWFWEIGSRSIVESSTSFTEESDLKHVLKQDLAPVLLKNSEFRFSFLYAAGLALTVADVNKNIGGSDIFPFKWLQSFHKYSSACPDAEGLLEWLIHDVAKWDAVEANRFMANYVLKLLKARLEEMMNFSK